MINRAFSEHSFQTFLSEGKLMGARSKATGKIFVPPRPIDPETHSDEMEWVELSGKGELAAFTAVYIGPNAMIEAGYDRKNPYLTGVVKLDEGPMISAQILGLESAKPEISHIGTPLTVTFIERGEEEEKRTFLAFEV
ncbi:MAG: Zn-ribbon domain-containing OB-fold protein [Chloroflexi bacterium]|nr:MAG: Zn-ribbon domain-containing OB-fold protein [Chloroflexota bacterium]